MDDVAKCRKLKFTLENCRKGEFDVSRNDVKPGINIYIYIYIYIYSE